MAKIFDRDAASPCGVQWGDHERRSRAEAGSAAQRSWPRRSWPRSGSASGSSRGSRALFLLILRVFAAVIVSSAGLALALSRATAGDVTTPFGPGWTQMNRGGATPPHVIWHFPGMPPFAVKPGSGFHAPSGKWRHESLKPSLSPAQRAAAARKEALKRAREPHKTHAQIRHAVLKKLFAELAKASDKDEASGIAIAIQRVWLHSDSATARLLMKRALLAKQGGHLPLALSLLDKIIALEPHWAEAWNERAMTRFLGGDFDGAMADIGHVLKLEPRQFVALAAMGFALHRKGSDKAALAAFRKSLAIDPRQPEIKAIVDKLSIEVEGRDI